MPMGKVKWFNDHKGFGFVEPDSGGPDVLVHQSVIEGGGYRTLCDGESVEYDAEQTPRGLKATRCRRLNPPKNPRNQRLRPGAAARAVGRATSEF